MNSKEKKFAVEINIAEMLHPIEITTDILKTYKRFRQEIELDLPPLFKWNWIKKRTGFEMAISLSIIQEEGVNSEPFIVFGRKLACIGIKGIFRKLDFYQEYLSKFVNNELSELIKD